MCKYTIFKFTLSKKKTKFAVFQTILTVFAINFIGWLTVIIFAIIYIIVKYVIVIKIIDWLHSHESECKHLSRTRV